MLKNHFRSITHQHKQQFTLVQGRYLDRTCFIVLDWAHGQPCLLLTAYHDEYVELSSPGYGSTGYEKYIYAVICIT